ncbi:CobW family GTP-binding protein [Oceanimonas marisflavi]|uniref:CobW family GTP-binding protein n=1 Tax=Oceanimonas marisflavi TaxID=2059724 RepID=UPI000D2FE864|nr:CobW family GTP-binding protein [Oceanimonas marisflavi]
MKMIKPIPVTLLTGFLGAGKTSYLNNLLREGIPPDSLILVNDFGSINIDAELIEYSDEHIMRLNNGCICCTLGGSLAEKLAELLRTPPLPAALYIEASGIANPARIVDTIRISPKLCLNEVICLVDGSQADRYSEDPLVTEVWHQQILSADRVLVNRLPPSLELPLVLKQLLVHSRAQVERMTGADEQPAVKDDHDFCSKNTGTGRWDSFSQTFDTAIDGQRLAELFMEYGDVLIRAKGMVRRQGKPQSEVVQLSGGKVSWSPAIRTTPKGLLVCIGAEGIRFNQLARDVSRLRGNP